MFKKFLKKIGIVSSALLIGISLFSFIPSVSKADSLGVTWTNGSLEAPLTPGTSAFKTNIGKTIGKWYWEITVNDTESPTNSNSMIGIVGEETSTDPGVWAKLAYVGYDGTLITTTNRPSYSTTYGNNDVIGLALDLDNDTITWFKNGTSCGDSKLKPSLLPGAQVFPLVANGTNFSGRTMNANFGASEFNYSIPEGFLPYDESSKTPTDPVDPVDPQPTGDRAILTVTMTTGLEKEFDLSMSEVNSFLNWYDLKENGSGPAKYGIDKQTNNKGPFSKRVDYVIFKNILSFEVDEYTLTK